MDKPISTAVVRRLPRYYRYLGDLMDHGIERISSGELSERMGITASQIRQDLNNFGGFGHQGYGYNVEYLHTMIGKILGLNRQYAIIILGAGHLGTALANYANFESRGFFVKALFDINPELAGTKVNGHQIYMMSELEAYLKEHETDIAVLALPKKAAQATTDILVENGVPAIWNFASIDLNVPDDRTIIENVHLSDSLMTLSYRLEHRD